MKGIAHYYSNQALLIDLKDRYGNMVSGLVESNLVIQDMRSKDNYNATTFNKFLRYFTKVCLQAATEIDDMLWCMGPKSNELDSIIGHLENKLEQLGHDFSIITRFENYSSMKNSMPNYYNLQLLFAFRQILKNVIETSKPPEIVVCVSSLNMELILSILVYQQTVLDSELMNKIDQSLETINFKLQIHEYEKTTKIEIVGSLFFEHE